jgi:hypothetical protein
MVMLLHKIIITRHISSAAHVFNPDKDGDFHHASYDLGDGNSQDILGQPCKYQRAYINERLCMEVLIQQEGQDYLE